MGTRRGRFVRLLAMLAGVGLLVCSGPTDAAIAEPVLPAPPPAVSVSQRSTMAILTWPAAEHAAGYAVDYDTSPSFLTAARATSDDTVAVLTGLIPDTPYFVRVAAWDPSTNTTGDWGSTITFTTGDREYPLAAPLVNLSAQTSTSVSADWTEPEPGLAYQVIMGTDPTSLSGQTDVDGTHVTFKKLERTTKYYVSVRAVDAAANPVTAWSEPTSLTTPESLPLRVGSYNILCENCSAGKATWAKRRGPLVAQIRAEDLDVLGVQEASIGGIPGGGTQYMDLIRRLGSPYKLTEYRRSASPDVRTIYNSDRLKLIKQGTIALPRGASKRFLGWAIFEQKSTGKRFFFSNTHLEPNDGRKGWTARKRQANAIVAATARLRDGLPVIAVGDYASTKWEKWGNAPYDVMQRAGYLDPLGNAYRSHNSAPGAFVEKRINTSYASLNMYKRKARNFPGDVNGSNTDYIFMTKMRVSEYEVVVRVDSAGRFIGVIPSDHNLIRATAYLP
ncbi:MAG: fibronectin type III domain-containing protein [Actinobacteria bacterium]|nr:fibronectin type III domain-containing protein [Actinomycetota bacterium]